MKEQVICIQWQLKFGVLSIMEEIKKSFNAILYKRTTSPLYGTFIITWLIWNWKSVYVTLFVSEKTIKKDKLTYILENHFIDDKHWLIYPIFSTILLLTIFPFISNGAYWLSLKFSKWKRDKKNEVELKQLLTHEQSIELREQILNQAERFEKLLSDKNLKIEQLENKLFIIEKQINTDEDSIYDENKGNNEELINLSEKIKFNEIEKNYYDALVRYIQGSFRINFEKTPSTFIAKMESHEIINSVGNGVYSWGKNGKEFNKLMLD